MKSASLAGIAPILFLAACGSTPKPDIRTVEVNVPVAVKCIPAGLRLAPTYPDTDAALKAAPGPGELLQLLAAGRLLRAQRLAELEPVVEACR